MRGARSAHRATKQMVPAAVFQQPANAPVQLWALISRNLDVLNVALRAWNRVARLLEAPPDEIRWLLEFIALFPRLFARLQRSQEDQEHAPSSLM